MNDGWATPAFLASHAHAEAHEAWRSAQDDDDDDDYYYEDVVLPPSRPVDPEVAEKLAEARRARQAWLESPEGRAAVERDRRREEQRARERAARVEREEREDATRARRARNRELAFRLARPLLVIAPFVIFYLVADNTPAWVWRSEFSGSAASYLNPAASGVLLALFLVTLFVSPVVVARCSSFDDVGVVRLALWAVPPIVTGVFMGPPLLTLF